MNIWIYFLHLLTVKNRYERNNFRKNKKIQKSQRITQEEVAERLHISQSAYARIETGESQSWATHLTKLSEIFEVKPESFLSDEANNFNNQNHELNGGMAFQFVGTINTINSLSEKLIEQYEERIQELKAEVQSLKTELSSLKK